MGGEWLIEDKNPSYPALQKKAFLFVSCNAGGRNDQVTIVRVNEKNVVINGLHLFLLVTVTRDGSVCQSSISLLFINSSCFISSLFFCPYIVYDRILKKFDLGDILLQKNSSFHCVSLFHAYMYHVLVYSSIMFVFKRVKNMR